MNALTDQTGDRLRGMLFAFATLSLLWPALLNGQPLLLDDSGSYLRGGAVGVSTGLMLVSEWLGSIFAPAGPAPPPADASSAKIAAAAIAASGGARSVVYSVFSFILRAPGNSMFGLALAQAGCVAFLIVRTQLTIASQARQSMRFAAVAAIVAFTGAAWYVSTAMPDIFAGILILAIILLTLHLDQLSVRSRLVLIGVIAVSITVHASHLPIALAMFVAGVVVDRFVNRGRTTPLVERSAWLAAPLLLGMIALLASSYVGFGEASLAPKRYPITLARSVNDGPGLWHLQKHCATERYAVCEIFGDRIPRGIDDFLWGPNGVRMRATPSQMERIRAEEILIVQRAAREYPLAQLWQAGVNLGDQLWQMGLTGLRFGNVLVASESGRIELVKGRADWPQLREISETLNYLSFFACLGFIGIAWKRFARAEVGAITLVVTGLIVNAGVCGILSAVTDRYQGRVAWVLPAVTLAILLRVYASRRRAEI